MVIWKRGFLEITAEILDGLKKTNLKKSHIGSKSSLDSRAVTKYLALMEKYKLVEKLQQYPSFYQATKKGLVYLEKYDDLMKILQVR